MLKLFKGRNQSLVGLDVRAPVIRMIELVPDAESFRIESYGVEPLPENAVTGQNIVEQDVVAETTNYSTAVSGFTPKCAAELSGSAVITKILEILASLNEASTPQ